MKSDQCRHAFTLIELLVTIAIIAVLIALILPAIQRVRSSAARAGCGNNLRQIGLALSSYHDTEHHLPPGVSNGQGTDTDPFMTWLTRILPYEEQSALWNQAQAAYQQDPRFTDSPPHPIATLVGLYSCPADSRTAQVGLAYGSLRVAFTDYLGVEGRNQVRKNGVLFLNSSIRFADVTDGTSNTLMVGERPPSADQVFGWWYAGTGQALDGSADSVLGVREWNTVLGVACPAKGEFGPGQIDNQCDMLHFWSMHSGSGANFLFADGSVHFLPYAAAPRLAALASRSGGEVVSLND